MNAKQQTMLLGVIAEWSGILTEPYACGAYDPDEGRFS